MNLVYSKVTFRNSWRSFIMLLSYGFGKITLTLLILILITYVHWFWFAIEHMITIIRSSKMIMINYFKWIIWCMLCLWFSLFRVHYLFLQYLLQFQAYRALTIVVILCKSLVSSIQLLFTICLIDIWWWGALKLFLLLVYIIIRLRGIIAI